MKKIHHGNLTIKKDTVCDFAEIRGNLYIYSDAKLDALTTVWGNLYIYSNTTLDALTTVGGGLYIRSNAKLDAKNLTTVWGDLYIYSDAKLDALTTVGCDLYIYSNAKLDALTTVWGDLYIYSNAKLDAKNLKNKNAGSVATNICRAALTAAMARADLLLKIGDRDKSKYKGWTRETKASLEEMIVAYRTIAGACGQGVSHFLSSKNYKGKLSVAFVIKETEGKYGHESFKGFFEKEEFDE